nr:putative ankyrin repeat protein [Megavirus caiporensis]
MKKINSYYKPSHNGKSKIHYKPIQRKKSDQRKINKQTNRQTSKQLKIKENKRKIFGPVSCDNEVNGSFLTPNGWIIADFITPKLNYQWYFLSNKYVNFYTRSHNNKNILDCLLKTKINFHECDNYNISHLMLVCACSFGDKNLALVKFLIKQGINVNTIDIFDKSALDYSLGKQGNIEIIKLLIKNIMDKSLLNKALLTWSNTHYLPNITIANILIKSGASINTTDDNGNSLLINIIREQLYDKLDIFNDNFTYRFTHFIHNVEVTKLREKNNFYETIIKITKFLLTNGIDTKLKSSINPGYIGSVIINWNKICKNKYSLLDYIFYEYDKQSDYNHFDKKQCCNKLIELFIVYGCEYGPYLYKLDSNHLEIIKTIEFSKKYFKTINNELKNIYTEFIYQPGSIRSNMIKIQWDYHIGLDYYDIKKSNQKLFDYFGINDEEKLIQIIKLV